jgi:magnesium transporter
VLDAQERLEGVLHLRKLLVADDDTLVRDLMEDDPECVGPEEPVAKVKRQMVRYQLLAIPVVDEEKKLLGVVTIYDLLEQMFDD